jgi:hypothetical protein
MWRVGRIEIPKAQGPVAGFSNVTMKPRIRGNERISCLAQRLSASEDGLYFMDLDHNLRFSLRRNHF